MLRARRRLAIAVLVGVGVFGVAACGDKSEPGSPSAAGPIATAKKWTPRLEDEAPSRTGRSVAVLPSGVPALDRDEALELLVQLETALVELRKLRAQGEVR